MAAGDLAEGLAAVLVAVGDLAEDLAAVQAAAAGRAEDSNLLTSPLK